mmetsp:Transcript_30594/g.49058  ORF Transcript_30594/g.49058 Transcript_30594/m.49058 type:complete len:203 (-) Transcript_30594:174-782(-)
MSVIECLLTYPFPSSSIMDNKSTRIIPLCMNSLGYAVIDQRALIYGDMGSTSGRMMTGDTSTQPNARRAVQRRRSNTALYFFFPRNSTSIPREPNCSCRVASSRQSSIEGASSRILGISSRILSVTRPLLSRKSSLLFLWRFLSFRAVGSVTGSTSITGKEFGRNSGAIGLKKSVRETRRPTEERHAVSPCSLCEYRVFVAC